MLLILRLTRLLVLLWLVGCVDHGPWHTLNQSHAPWSGPHSRAKLQERLSAMYLPCMPIPPSGWREYRYVNLAEAEKFDPVQMGQGVEAYLRKQGQFEVQLKPSHRDDQIHVEQFRRWQEGKEPSHAIPLVTPFRLTLVSLDPVVVLITDQMSTYNEKSYLMLLTTDYAVDHLPTGDAGVVKRDGLVNGFPILPGGVIPRTRLTEKSQVQWFSPTLRTGPKPLNFDANGVAKIRVPWGRLLVYQMNDALEVAAEPYSPERGSQDGA